MTLFASFIGLPLIASPLIYLAGHRPRYLAWLDVRHVSLLLLVMLWIALASIGLSASNVEAMSFSAGVISLHMDGLSLLMTSLILLLATFTIVFSMPDIAGTEGAEKYYALVFILTGMLIGLVCANDLFNLWIWFEGAAIASYLLVAFYRERENALAACVKYFVQTASGSMFVLFGIALVFLHSGTLILSDMHMTPTPLLIVAGGLFVMGFGVKAALFPNFTWLPDAYAESPSGVSAFLSGVVTVTGLIALLKALAVIVGTSAAWTILLLVIASLNIVIGNILALSQTQVKRILAYSSVSHIGFILLAVGIGIASQSLLGMQGAVLHLFVHGLMKSLGFFAVGALAFALGRNKTSPVTIQDLNGAGQRYPLLAFTLTVSLLSLAGVPLFAGFISKWLIFVAGVQSQSGWIIGLVAFAALNSVFSLAYYLPIINALYIAPTNAHWQNTPAIPLAMRLPVLLLAFALIVLGIVPNLLDWLMTPAAEALLLLFTGGG